GAMKDLLLQLRSTFNIPADHAFKFAFTLDDSAKKIPLNDTSDWEKFLMAHPKGNKMPPFEMVLLVTSISKDQRKQKKILKLKKREEAARA
ncbi:hypothetical protein ACQJ2V_28185, partial [Klebsiella variicola subsp. variicola]|uniref:hypothetical protein n=1 Tax=Klebsiella variicola TaxID=244366 RepID=UPI003D0954E9